jgi:hypothetical protein
MITVALALAAAQATAVDAERAFAAMAQTHGQWTAFRKYALPQGHMFVPERVAAQQWLQGRADPPVSVMWWPAQAFRSCDGSVAVTTGPWVRDGGKLKGYFTTLWVRQPDGQWRWWLDHGDTLALPRAAGDRAQVRTASCKRLPVKPGGWSELLLGLGDGPGIGLGGTSGEGRSADGSLTWQWKAAFDGSRTVEVKLWDGARAVRVLKDQVAAPST